MGGPGDMMIANQIDYYARQLTDFSGAAAVLVSLAELTPERAVEIYRSSRAA